MSARRGPRTSRERPLTRRAVVASLGAAGLATTATAVPDAGQVGSVSRGGPAGDPAVPTEAGGWRRIRRVVTTRGADGRGVVLADGEPGNAQVLNGTRIVRLWESGVPPVALPLAGDAGATAGNAYREGFAGTSFYVAELPGGARAPSIPMHRNETLDYMAILSGRIVLKLDSQEIELGPGDVIVQGGNDHTWINRWQESCMLLFVVVTGRGARA